MSDEATEPTQPPAQEQQPAPESQDTAPPPPPSVEELDFIVTRDANPPTD